MRLRVESLEARETPATFAYDGTTLTVTAGPGETITVDDLADSPAGYVSVSDGLNTFSSADDGAGPVTNVVLDFSGVPSGIARLSEGASIGGKLTVFGAQESCLLRVSGDVGKHVTYLGSGGGDSVVLDTTAEIGGNLSMAMGGGDDFAYLDGGRVHGNLSFRGGAGVDALILTADGDVTIDGSASFKLGAGDDKLASFADGLLTVGGDLRFNLGAGNDHLRFNNGNNETTTHVGGDFRIKAGDGGGIGNEVHLAITTVGGDFALAGGADVDDLTAPGGLITGGSASFALGDGQNSVYLVKTDVGGAFSFLGGLARDFLTMDRFQVGGNMAVDTLGSLVDGAEAVKLLGKPDNTGRVFGSVAIRGGIGGKSTFITDVHIAGNLSFAAVGGTNYVSIDDTAVVGKTTISLGSGHDLLGIDNIDEHVGECSFGGKVVVKAGAGDDRVYLSAHGGNRSLFGSTAVFTGGAGDEDRLDNSAANQWFGPDGTEDFEIGNGVLLA